MGLTTINITLVELAIFGSSAMTVGAIIVNHFKKRMEDRYIQMVLEEKHENTHLTGILNYYKPILRDAVENKMYRDILYNTIEDLEKYKSLAFGFEKTRTYVELEALRKVVERTKEELGVNPLEKEELNKHKKEG